MPDYKRWEHRKSGEESSDAQKYQIDGTSLDDDQISAFKAINDTKSNYFVTGKAGTGKSLLLKYFMANAEKRVVVLAPTGIAAINVGGQTIHSFFGLKPQLQNVAAFSAESVSNREKELYRSVDTIVIDEISMVRSDIMDMIDAKLRAARDPLLPFGGCQMVVLGDLYQLPPVIGNDENETKYILDSYGSEFFFAAPTVQEHPFTVIELTNVHRQNDRDFVDNLNRIRVGDSDYSTIGFFNRRVQKIRDKDGIISLTTRKIAAELINRQELRKLDSEEYIYHGSIEGDFLPNDLPTDLELHLKVGAQIMMVKNDSDRRWVNGSVGKISCLEKDFIQVNINGRCFAIARESWTKVKYIYDEEKHQLEQITVGAFTQFPIQLAYAVTIHKSQGRTYDKAIINYSEGHAFAAGQTYVALSRCKSLDGLYLEEPLTSEDIKIHPEVINFYNGTFHHDVVRIPFVENNRIQIEWLEDNRIKVSGNKKPKKITGTRFASIMNLDRFKTPFAVWCAIMHVYERPFEPNVFTRAGKTIEAEQLEYVKRQFSQQIASPDEVFGENAKEKKGYDFFAGNEVFGGMWDSVLTADGENKAVLEMKTTSAKHEEWRYDPPISYLLQAALYAWLMEIDDFYIVLSFILGREYFYPEYYSCNECNTSIQHYKLSNRFPDFEEQYIRRALKWWNDHVETGISPRYDLEKDKDIIEILKSYGKEI